MMNSELLDALLTMDAGRELDIAIAKLAGWRLEKRGENYLLINPQDECLTQWDLHVSEDYVFNMTWRAGLINDYSTDANVALGLLMDAMKAGANKDYTTYVSPSSNTDEWVCVFDPHYRSLKIARYAPTAALAIVRAWLTLKLVQEGGAK